MVSSDLQPSEGSSELCVQQGWDTEPWAGVAVLETGCCGQDFMCELMVSVACAHGDGWGAAATAVSPLPCAGPQAVPAEPVIPHVAAWCLKKFSCALPPVPPHPQEGAVGACAVYSQCPTR